MATLAKENSFSKVIELSKLLASNNPNTRSNGIKKIKTLIEKYSGETTDGLFCLITYFSIVVRIYVGLVCMAKEIFEYTQ